MSCCLSQPPASLFPVQQHPSQPSPALQQQLFYPRAAACYDGGSLISSGRKQQGLAAAPPQLQLFQWGRTCNRRTFGEALKNKRPLPNTTSGGDLQSSQDDCLKAVVGLCYYGFHTLPMQRSRAVFPVSSAGLIIWEAGRKRVFLISSDDCMSPLTGGESCSNL